MDSTPNQPDRRCLVVYDHLPHYRFGVFSELQRADGWKFTFAAAARSRDGSIATIPLERLDSTITLRNRWIGPLLWQTGLIRAVSAGYDCVVFLGSAKNVSTWVSAALCRLVRRPVYFWTIGWHRPEKGLKRKVRKTFYSLADRLMLYGEDGLSIGIAMGYPARKMSVIGNSHSGGGSPDVSDEVGGESLQESLPQRGRPCIGAVARLTPEKRMDLLVEAAGVLRARGHDLVVLLVGAGPASPSLEAMALAAKVPLYRPGALHSEDALAEVYERLTLTVLPERAGLTVIQSLRFGVPVVTVDDPYRQVPEYRAVVPGVTGELYPPADVEGLAHAIERCLDLVEADQTRVAQACRDEVNLRWSATRHADRVLEVLNRGTPDGRGIS